MSALEAILLRDQVLAQDKLQEAKALQRDNGGNLDTAILELGFLPENVVHAYCAAVYGVTPATRSEVMNASYDVVRILTREFSVRHRAIPVAANGPSLVLVVDRHFPEVMLAEIRDELKYEPVQRVVATARMEGGLSQHYGVELSKRMRHLVDRLDIRDPGVVPYIQRYQGRGVRSELPPALTSARPLRSSSVPAAPLVQVTATGSNPAGVRTSMPRVGAYSARPAGAEVLGRPSRERISVPQPQPKLKGVPLSGSWRAPLIEAKDLDFKDLKPIDLNGHGATAEPTTHDPETGRVTLIAEPPPEEISATVVKVADDVREVIRTLANATNERAAQIIDSLRTMGEAALPALVREFPGPVRGSADPSNEPLFESSPVGPLFSAMLSFGKDALPYAWSLLTHEDPLKRYYAILLLVRLDGSASCTKIWRCVFDGDERVSQLALRVLSHIPEEDTQLIEQVLEQVRVMLRFEGRDPQKLKAVKLLSELRDASAVRMLIETLEHSNDDNVKQQTRQALIRITAQDFGEKAHKWTAWYDRNHKSDRIAWLVSGLSNNDSSVRQRALEELTKFASDTFGYEATASTFARRRAVKRWENWHRERAQSE